MTRAETEAASLVIRSAKNHLRYFKPGAEQIEPRLYAGKPESTIMTVVLDLFGADAKELPNPLYSLRALSAFNQQWRAYDEVLDEKHPAIDPQVTETELDMTSVYHKYAEREVTGKESRRIALASVREAIPSNGPTSRRKLGKFEELLLAYRKRVADTANNPQYHRGEILSFDLALQNKREVTGFLGSVGASLIALLLDRDDQSTIDLCTALGVALQFGDDYLDWRKDIVDHEKKKKETGRFIRPIENLLVATLAENTAEMAACREYLSDKSKRSALWLKELAPKTLDAFRARYEAVLDKLPPHKYVSRVKDIFALTFYRLLPRAPESGWFYRWAKY